MKTNIKLPLPKNKHENVPKNTLEKNIPTDNDCKRRTLGMGNIKGIFSLVAIFILPAALLVGMSYLGAGHPLENKPIEGSWDFLETSENEVEVLFFGYAGCSFICPDALMKLGDALDEMEVEKRAIPVGGLFIDVNASLQLNRAQKYAHFFSSNIKGINTDQSSLKMLKEEFKVRTKEDPRVEGGLYHTDHFFVLKKIQGVWSIVRVLSNDTSKDQLKSIIKNQLNPEVDVTVNRI